MRGKGPPQLLRCRVKGITPAYAGKSIDESMTIPAEGDHPRVCGEKTGLPFVKVAQIGSPPRMRGKVPKFWARLRVPVDHPRVCGEKAAYLRAVWVPKGSPPRMRGKV